MCRLIKPVVMRFLAFILAASVGVVAHYALRSGPPPTVTDKPVLTFIFNSPLPLEGPTSVYTIYDTETPKYAGRFFPDSNKFIIDPEPRATRDFICSRCQPADSEWLRSSGLNWIRPQKEY